VSGFFGGELGNFAMLCFSDVKTNKVKKMLKTGEGYGRDTVSFASKGLLMSGPVASLVNQGCKLVLNQEMCILIFDLPLMVF